MSLPWSGSAGIVLMAPVATVAEAAGAAAAGARLADASPDGALVPAIRADMTESILGRRPPAWATRGLA